MTLTLDNFYLDNTSIVYNEPSSKTRKLKESRIRSINLNHCRFILECFENIIKIDNHVLIANSLFFLNFLPKLFKNGYISFYYHSNLKII